MMHVTRGICITTTVLAVAGAQAGDEVIRVAPAPTHEEVGIRAMIGSDMHQLRAAPQVFGQAPAGGIAGGGIGVVCADTVNGCQLPDQMGHGGAGIVGATSDVAAGFSVLERWTTDGGGAISTLCWWGFYLDFDAGADCGIDDANAPADNFTVTIFQNTPGCPASEPNFALAAGPFSVTATRAATGAINNGNAEFEYTATLPAPINIPAGNCAWIQIQNDTTASPLPNCFWLWSTAPTVAEGGSGDGISWQTGLNDFDLAVCVGFDAGTPDNCQLAVNVLCVDQAGECFEPNGSAGCNEECCCTLVCQTNAFCCNVQWDENCAAQGIDLGCTALPPIALCDADQTLPPDPTPQCQVYDLINAFNSTTDPGAGIDQFLVADDFTPTADGSVSQVCWQGVYGVGPVTDSFTVRIFLGDGDGGVPGTMLTEATEGAGLTVARADSNQSIDLGGGVEATIFQYDATLDTPLAVTAGECYWLQISNGIADQGETWFWQWANLGAIPANQAPGATVPAKEGNGRFVIDGDGGTNPPDGYDFFDQGTTQDFGFCLAGLDLEPAACGFDARYDTGVHQIVIFNGTSTNLGFASGDLDVGPGVDDQRRTAQMFELPPLPVGATADGWSIEHLLVEGFDPGANVNETITFQIFEFTAADIPPTDDDLIAEFVIDIPDGLAFDAVTTETGAIIQGFGLAPGTYWLTQFAGNSDPDTFASNLSWFTNAPDGINNVCTVNMPAPAPGFEGCQPNDPVTGDPPGTPAMFRARTYPVPGFGAYTLDPSVLTVDPANDPTPDPADLYNTTFRMRGRAVVLAAPCPYDCANADGNVDTPDFLALLGQWSQVATSCDPDGDGVDTIDFLALLGAWGPCP